ncbi:hypothetical protein BATDEDRAFT_22563 [Batrachochytrium dendrobatidis JAM81]|uniref:Intimal thickness related receptor IRP domain-containing protein n=1 Tax=Batrachochytrium dendrobatidis (strain JAM81 / FGSC 10211) TaxID=684364 RepID=F4NV63_BATDJ|nr:uncharacterized protein BATDEDRAFT_22563 [Batrachochytrium dendrobatidis JAM81]EGF84482.1 hypothetical protein BATDEDRAFT_22563 [Batrachochytrium dendrobatidis JAM81]|eukprot:XP_006675598.1 hypothetical protein BATDEDRAFT_22563 [Batrachochytrium dendrobatidis JAM81]
MFNHQSYPSKLLPLIFLIAPTCLAITYQIDDITLSVNSTAVLLTPKPFGFLSSNSMQLSWTPSPLGNASAALSWVKGVYVVICSAGQMSTKTGTKLMRCSDHIARKTQCGEMYSIAELQVDPTDSTSLTRTWSPIPTGFKNAYLAWCNRRNSTSNSQINNPSRSRFIESDDTSLQNHHDDTSILDHTIDASYEDVLFTGSVTIHLMNEMVGSSELSLQDLIGLISTCVFICLWMFGVLKWFWKCLLNYDQFKNIWMVQLISAYIMCILLCNIVRIAAYLNMESTGASMDDTYAIALYIFELVEIFMSVSIQLLLSKGVSIVRSTLTFVERDTIAVLVIAFTCTFAFYGYHLPGSLFGSLAMVTTVYVALACNLQHVMNILEYHIGTLQSTSYLGRFGQQIVPTEPSLNETINVYESLPDTNAEQHSNRRFWISRNQISHQSDAMHITTSKLLWWQTSTLRTVSITDPIWNIKSIYMKKLEIVKTSRYFLLFWGILPAVTQILDIFQLEASPAPSMCVSFFGHLVIFAWFVGQLGPRPVSEVVRLVGITQRPYTKHKSILR